MAISHALQEVVVLLKTHFLQIFLGLIIARAIYRRYAHPLRQIPGPFLASISNSWIIALQFSSKQHLKLIDLHRKYGPVIRISPNRVIMTSPEHLHEYFAWAKSDFWKAFQPHPTILSHGSHYEPGPHKIAKAKIMGAFNMSHLIKSEHKVDSHVIRFMDKLKDLTGTAFDFSPWSQWFAFDVVMDVTFSKHMGFVSEAKDVDGLIASLHGLLFAGSIAGLYPKILQFLNHPLWYPLFSPKPTAKRGIGRIHGLAYESVRARFQEPNPENVDALQWMISHRGKDGTTLSQAIIEQEATSPVVAGSDTTAGLIRAMLLYTATNARVYNKLMAQIDAADRSGQLSTPPRFEEVGQHIPYLEAIRKESLRMVPIAANPFFRKTPPEGAIVDGYIIPGGTEVGISHWPISRDPVFWGDDAETFRPERWTDEKDEYRKKMRDLGFVFFSDGVFMCTGRNLALMEVMKCTAELFRRFDVEVVNPIKPWEELGSMAVIHWDFFIRLTPRKQAVPT